MFGFLRSGQAPHSGQEPINAVGTQTLICGRAVYPFAVVENPASSGIKTLVLKVQYLRTGHLSHSNPKQTKGSASPDLPQNAASCSCRKLVSSVSRAASCLDSRLGDVESSSVFTASK